MIEDSLSSTRSMDGRPDLDPVSVKGKSIRPRLSAKKDKPTYAPQGFRGKIQVPTCAGRYGNV